MPVKKQPVKYETDDGREFDTQAAAEKHDKIRAVREAYTNARQAWVRAVAEGQTTADGQPFGLTMMTNYYMVRRYIGGRPWLEQVSFYAWNCDLNDDDEGVIRHKDDKGHWQEYRIAELFFYQANARDAMANDLRKYIEEVQEELHRYETGKPCG